MDNDILNLCKKGDVDAINIALNHEGALYRINGIISCVTHLIKSKDVISNIKKLLDDNVIVSGYSVSEFALASLDLLEVSKYKGNDEKVKSLIECKFEF